MNAPSAFALRAELRESALGIGTATPRLSWKAIAEQPDLLPEFELTLPDGTTSYATGASANRVLAPWPFEPLQSRQRVQVRVREASDERESWSPPLWVEAGLLSPEDWSASFISPRQIGGLEDPAPIISTSRTVEAVPERARLYVTALGAYEFFVNGQRVCDEHLAPGWTTYGKRLLYQTYDIRSLLRPGQNEFSATLGNGWYRGHLRWDKKRDFYGSRLALLAQIELGDFDGATTTIVTDESWTAHEGRVRSDDLYDGTVIDLRAAEPDPRRDAVEVIDPGSMAIEAPVGPPVRVTQTVAAQRIWISPAGTTLVDFGQNLVGWVRIDLGEDASVSESAPPDEGNWNTPRLTGDTVTVRHAEVLEHEELAVRPLRDARATDSYLVDQDTQGVLEPAFTFHGFRYASIEGIENLSEYRVHAVVVGTDLEQIGGLTTSSGLLNRLHENMMWSARGNFLSVPTDCPQRDERMGWTGDIQVFAPAAAAVFDVDGFLASWLRDLALDQGEDGGVPNVIPDIIRDGAFAAAWGDAAVILPQVLYQRFGDREALEQQFASAVAWVECVRAVAGEDLIWDEGPQYGDWLDPWSPPRGAHLSRTETPLVATACFARCAAVVADIARVLGREEERATYEALFEDVRTAFLGRFGAGSGTLTSDSQTAYSMALCWGLFDEADRPAAGARLATLVRERGHRVGTGFVGTPLVLDALTDAGYADDAMAMMLQTQLPSWLYPVTRGATTIWERWDSLLPDGSVHPGEMTSFNHYAYGAVVDWMHRRIGGIAAAEPAYRTVRIAPLVWTTLTDATGWHESAYGRIEVAWSRTDEAVTLRVTLPPGVTGQIDVPDSTLSGIECGAGVHLFVGERVPQPTPTES